MEICIIQLNILNFWMQSFGLQCPSLWHTIAMAIKSLYSSRIKTPEYLPRAHRLHSRHINIRTNILLRFDIKPYRRNIPKATGIYFDTLRLFEFQRFSLRLTVTSRGGVSATSLAEMFCRWTRSTRLLPMEPTEILCCPDVIDDDLPRLL